MKKRRIVNRKAIYYGQPLTRREEELLVRLLIRDGAMRDLNSLDRQDLMCLRTKLGFDATLTMLATSHSSGAAKLLLTSKADVQLGKRNALDPDRRYVPPAPKFENAAERHAWLLRYGKIVRDEEAA